jgi:hypothetical protein
MGLRPFWIVMLLTLLTPGSAASTGGGFPPAAIQRCATTAPEAAEAEEVEAQPEGFMSTASVTIILPFFGVFPALFFAACSR